MKNRFEWDNEKAASNLIKHKVSFEEAATVFDDALSVTFPDPDHSIKELREITIGYSLKNRVLLVFSTERNNKIRIFSAREASKKERKLYEESI
ncbi:MAG: BrnT family toxin [Candidatus Kapabacteria bacterium]|nr:BrnT family toxin [Candidatus Kapabacteria bacterium]